MKKLTLAIVVLALVTVTQASADMVDIGLGQMEQSEFIALQAMVRGRQPDVVPAISTPLDRPERYGPVEMVRADFEALRDKVAGRSASTDTRPAAKAVQMVNIGTGEMPMDEFIALKNIVKGTGIFKWDHLASAQP
ncbi:MAG: hypothetical protein KQI81_05780 [Deltaproteobacteria bacterium]|nr:hypothetical protein [Deltaproteobacteria bacterium]